MNASQGHTARSYFRADYILVATTLLVCVLVGLLLLALANESALHRQTLRTIFEARSARDGVMSLTQSLADADAARRAMLIAGDRDAQALYANAQSMARENAARLEATAQATSPEIASAVASLRQLTERYLTELDRVTPTQLRSARLDPTAATHREIMAAADVVRELVNARNDAARDREDRVRQRIDIIAAVLAIVAFLAPVLAILAVRRERDLWRTANEMAEAARAQATQSDLAKSRFLAVASHDMRQPLHALSLYISALERRIESAEARDILTKMDRATQSLVGMFSKLLDLARVQAGAVKLEIIATPLQDVIDKVAAEHPESAVTYARSSAIIRTDPILLERLLGNLVSNALKHGGGKVRIELAEHRDTVELIVSDNGPGIPPEDQQRIFDEFVRLGRTTDGLGLGLSIVRRIADLLKIPIAVESSPGAGTKFRTRVPRDTSALARPTASPNGEALVGQSVLVMDDDENALEAMSGAFRDMGAIVRGGAREAELITVLDSGFAPRLLVLDLRIDGEIIGVEIARRLRQRIAPPPPVIIVTGDTAPETLAILQLSGFVWLIKPVNPDDVRNAAEALLSST